MYHSIVFISAQKKIHPPDTHRSMLFDFYGRALNILQTKSGNFPSALLLKQSQNKESFHVQKDFYDPIKLNYA